METNFFFWEQWHLIHDSNGFILIVRLLCLLAAGTMTYWSYKSLRRRKAIGLGDYGDYMLVIVGAYWIMYLAWSIWNFSIVNSGTVPSSMLVFNQRFGLLLTLSAFTALVKDRLLLVMVFEELIGNRVDQVFQEEAAKIEKGPCE